MSFKDAIGAVKDVTSILGEARRLGTAVTNVVMPKKALMKEIEELKEELRREQRKNQSILIAIKQHKSAIQEASYPRKFEGDQTLWALLESTPEPNGKLSDHPIKGK